MDLTFNQSDPIPCPKCGTSSTIVGRDKTGRWFYCSSCGDTSYFYDFKCPVCGRMNTMYEKPKLNNCYQCDNCLTIVVFTEIKDVGDKYEVKWKWYSGRYKDKVVEQFKKFERK